MQSLKTFFNLRSIHLIMIVLFTITVVTSAAGHTFATFNTTTITGGSTAFSSSLDGSALSSGYLFFIVTGEFVGGASPAYSNTIEMSISDGATVDFKSYSTASSGALNSSSNTTLLWSGVFNKVYQGGDNLSINIKDTYDDGSGSFTSQLNNVTVTIYVAPTPIKTFPTFATTTLTGGGSAYVKSLDVTGLTLDYLFYVVQADFVAGVNSAYSSTINMELNNAASIVYKSSGTATAGKLESASNTTLFWTGVMKQTYPGGDDLSV